MRLALLFSLVTVSVGAQTSGTGNVSGSVFTFGTGVNTATTTTVDKICRRGDYVAIRVQSDGTLDDRPFLIVGGFAPEVSDPRFDFALTEPGIVGVPVTTGVFFLVDGIFNVTLPATVGPGSGTLTSFVMNAPPTTLTDAVYLQAIVQSALFPQGFGLSVALEVDQDEVHNLAPNTVHPLGDDAAVLAPLGYTLNLYGGAYTDVWVSSNGMMQFGSPNTSPTGSTIAMFSGAPKIAGLWQDLDPTVAGQISTFTDGSGYFEAAWYNVQVKGVPSEQGAFRVGIANSGLAFQYRYDATFDQGLVGLTPGASAVPQGESDLSGSGPIVPNEAFYQLFDGVSFPFDMAGRTLAVFMSAGQPFYFVSAIY